MEYKESFNAIKRMHDSFVSSSIDIMCKPHNISIGKDSIPLIFDFTTFIAQPTNGHHRVLFTF